MRILAPSALPLRTIRRLAGVLFLGVLAYAVAGGRVPAAAAQAPAARTAWDGVFTAAQAERGRGFYLADCASCHGAALEGAESRALAGDRFWAAWQETTVEYLLTHVSKNMPFSEDGSLAGTLGMPVYTDIVAHILSTNGFPAGSTELTPASSAGVQIVRKEGGELPTDSFAHVVGCLVRGADRAWRLQQASRPARVLTGVPVDTATPLGDREYVLKFVLTSLDKFAGHRMSVTANLIGAGGSEGLNVREIRSVSARCE